METITYLNFPKKTKIGAWWIIILGGIGIIVFFLGLSYYGGGDWIGVFMVSGTLWILSILLLLGGILILKRKRWAWVSVIFLLLFTIYIIWGAGMSMSGLIGLLYKYCSYPYSCMKDIQSLSGGAIEFKIDSNCETNCDTLITFVFLAPYLLPLILFAFDIKKYWNVCREEREKR